MIAELLHWLVSAVARFGYLGLIVLMAMESSFIPLPSELVLPPAGYLVHQGRMNLILVIVCGVTGSVLGALFNYWLGFRFGRDFLIRYGRYVGLNEHRYLKTEKFFIDHGEVSTFVGRLLLGVRHFISFPAGVARMNLLHFIFYTAFGAAIWCTILTVLGYYVGREEALLHRYYREVVVALAVFCLLVVGVYVWVHIARRKVARKESSDLS
jgi:membrane protein DedA with SNARE-associated domain